MHHTERSYLQRITERFKCGMATVTFGKLLLLPLVLYVVHLIVNRPRKWNTL